MPGLVHPHFSPARQRNLRQLAPRQALHRLAGHLLLTHRRHEGLDVAAHEKELVFIILRRRVHRQLRRRQGKDQPAIPHVHVRQPQNSRRKARSASGFWL